jgi:2,3-bisphosphoglycerate-independent phosphoglycerate mutase
MTQKKVLLCILDGWGEAPPSSGNIIQQNAPFFYETFKKYNGITIQASEEYVGLPHGQMGNSEVGHMTIGLGRPIFQDLLKISKAFDAGIIQNNPILIKTIQQLKNCSGTFHIAGLLSDGGVHSHINHIISAIHFSLTQNVPVYLHTFLDGRDTPPQSAITFIQKITELFNKNPLFHWGTISGRYYAMDRDKRFERIQKTYDAILKKEGLPLFADPSDYIQNCYNHNINDEFIEPAYHLNYKGINADKDVLWLLNFRPDRVKEILQSLLFENFDAFDLKSHPLFQAIIGFHHYFPELKNISTFHALFDKGNHDHSLGEIISKLSLKQFRIAETEKYAHVTFFLNGGQEKSFEGETRSLIPSPQIATYDLQPEMSAFLITDVIEKRIVQEKDDLIIVNYANADMVGHTGNISATVKAIQTLDKCLQTLVKQCLENDYAMIITADHGNAEKMLADDGVEPFTAHTLNQVPFVIIDKEKHSLKNNGTLADIAPTILNLMDINPPTIMTGKTLIEKENLF